MEFLKIPLKIKTIPKIKTVKNAFFIKIIKNINYVFYIYGLVSLISVAFVN